MAIYLGRTETVDLHIDHVNWREGLSLKPPKPTPRLNLAKYPSVKSVGPDTLALRYHAPRLIQHLQTYLRRHIPPRPTSSRESISSAIDSLATRHLQFAVWHRIRVLNHPTQDIDDLPDRKDAVHASPVRFDKKKSTVISEERFDTVLVDEKGIADETGMEGESSNRPRPMNNVTESANQVFVLVRSALSSPSPTLFFGPSSVPLLHASGHSSTSIGSLDLAQNLTRITACSASNARPMLLNARAASSTSIQFGAAATSSPSSPA